MKLIDTHCHLICEQYKNLVDPVITRAHKNDIEMITCGTNFTNSKQSIDLANKYPFIYASVGFAPHDIKDNIYDEHEFELLVSQSKICAIGECGLDYYYFDNKKEQQQIFISQILLSLKYKLPLIIHCRASKEDPNDAFNDLFDILTEHQASKGVLHSFGGNAGQAAKFIQLGFHLGFNGIITFDKQKKSHEVLKNIPLEKILLETDSPYLSPVPVRGNVNEPSNLMHIVEFMAVLLKTETKNLAHITTTNAINLFNLKTYAI